MDFIVFIGAGFLQGGVGCVFGAFWFGFQLSLGLTFIMRWFVMASFNMDCVWWHLSMYMRATVCMGGGWSSAIAAFQSSQPILDPGLCRGKTVPWWWLWFKEPPFLCLNPLLSSSADYIRLPRSLYLVLSPYHPNHQSSLVLSSGCLLIILSG